MYYLNDKHYKYQYGLYAYKSGGSPYVSEILSARDILDVYRESEEIGKRAHHYHRIFYIDNNFYENEYEKSFVQIGGTYYKFLKRPIADWIDLDEEEVEDYEKLSKRGNMAA